MRHKIIFIMLIVIGAVASSAEVVGRPVLGGITPVDDDGTNPDILEGKNILYETLENGTNWDRNKYDVSVTLPDLEVSSQVVSGTIFYFFYTREEYCIERKNGSKCKWSCSEDCEIVITKNRNCTASYFVQPWTNTKQFKGPVCKSLDVQD